MTASGVGAFFGVGKNVGADLQQAKVARDRFFAINKAEIELAIKKVPHRTSRRRDVDDVILDENDVKWSLETEATTEGALLYFLTSLLGTAPTSVQDGGDASYLHTYAGVGDTTTNAGRLTLEKRLGTQALSWLANGVVEEWEFSFSQQGAGVHKFSGPGSLYERLATPTVATFPSVATILARRMGAFTLDGVTTLPIVGGSWKVKAGRKMDDFVATGRDRRDADFDGDFEVTFGLDVLAPDDGWLRRYMGGSAVNSPAAAPEATYACNIKYERPDAFVTTRKHSITLDLPKVSLTNPGKVAIDGSKTLAQRIEGLAVFNSGTSRSLTMAVRSSQTGA